MNEEELSQAIESYVESFMLVEYGVSGLQAARDAHRDMGLEEDGVTFAGFILQTEEDIAELVVEEFITRVS